MVGLLSKAYTATKNQFAEGGFIRTNISDVFRGVGGGLSDLNLSLIHI